MALKGAVVREMKPAMVVTEVRKTGSMSTSMVATTDAFTSRRCRISRKKRVMI